MAGFNAWNQLSFGEDVGRSESSGEFQVEPDDVTSFTRNLSAETIGRPVSHLAYTLGTWILFSLDAPKRSFCDESKRANSALESVKADGRILVAGFLDTSDAGPLARLYHSASTATGKTLGKSLPWKQAF